MIYKSQLPPTVEPEFYARAVSPLLPRQRALGALGRCATMVIDWIDAPALSDVAHGEAELVAHGRQVVARIGEIRGDLPVYQDIGSPRAWAALASFALDGLRQLVRRGWINQVNLGQVDRLQTWVTDPDTIDRGTAGARVVHGDLGADQVFVTADGYRVIDWQRPAMAPPGVDLVSLLVGEGINPRPHVSAVAVRAFWLLRLHWAVEAQTHLFPEQPWPMFDEWSAEATRQILA